MAKPREYPVSVEAGIRAAAANVSVQPEAVCQPRKRLMKLMGASRGIQREALIFSSALWRLQLAQVTLCLALD